MFMTTENTKQNNKKKLKAKSPEKKKLLSDALRQNLARRKLASNDEFETKNTK